MATRFMYKALLTAALGIASSLLLSSTPTTSPASSSSAGAHRLDPPAAPSHCQASTARFRDAYGYYWRLSFVTWTDNSTNEDGFTVEAWQRNQSGVWVLAWSRNLAANSNGMEVGHTLQGYRFRVKAFNASGDSAWSNWGR